MLTIYCLLISTTNSYASTPPVITAISVNPMAQSCVDGTTDIQLIPSIDDGDGLPGDSGAPYTFEWSGPDGFNAQTELAIISNGTSADNGIYTLTVTNNTGCVSMPVSVEVLLVDTPLQPILFTNESQYCQGDTLTLMTPVQAGLDTRYIWRKDGIPLDTTSIPILEIPNLDINNNGAYAVAILKDACISMFSELVIISVQINNHIPFITGENRLCAGSPLLLETPLISDATYHWTGPSGFMSNTPKVEIPSTTEENTGTYTVQVAINGCLSLVSIPFEVEVDEMPLIPVLENVAPLCLDTEGAVLTLQLSMASATSGAQYEWYAAQGNTFLGTSGTNTSFQLNDFSMFTDGVYQFYAMAQKNDCESPPSLPVTVIMNNTPNDIADAGEQAIACEGVPFNLNGNIPSIGTGMWTQLSGTPVTIVTPSAPNSMVEGMTTGNAYTFRWTLSNGACGAYSSSDVNVLVNSSTQSAEAGTATATCFSTSTNLQATPPNTGIIGTWSQSLIQAQLGINIGDINNPNTEIEGLTPGNEYQFVWTLSNNICGNFSSDTVTVVFEDVMVQAEAMPDFEVCSNEAVNISASLHPNCTGFWASPNPELVFIDSTASQTQVMDLGIGDNLLIWNVDCGGCGASADTLNIFLHEVGFAVPDIAHVNYGESTLIDMLSNDALPENYTVQLTNAPTFGTASVIDNFIEYQHQENSAQPDQLQYQICTDACPDACSSPTTISIIIDVDCNIPNILTPNNDGINDVFVVECLFATGKYPNSRLLVFNQWGDELVNFEPYENNWDGRYDGALLAEGTYYYYLELRDGSAPYSGFLLIER